MRKSLLATGKRGNVFFEGLSTLLYLVGFIMVAIAGYIFLSDYNTDVQSDTELSIESQQITQTATDDFPSMVDTMALFAFIGLWILAYVFAYFVESNPIFLFISIGLLVLLQIFIVYLGNTSYEIFTSGDFATSFELFTYINFIFENLLVINIVLGAWLVIVLMVKK